MDEIKKYNCDGMCVEEYCGERYTHIIVTEVFGIKVCLGFCKEHAEEIDKFLEATK